MEVAEAAWLAGYLDGDGCICLSKRSGKSARTPELVIDSCDKELLDKVVSLVGGTIVKKKRYHMNRRQGWHWRVNGAVQVLGILEQLLPYLTCKDKAERAKLIVEEWRKCTPRNGCYTLEMLAAKDDFELRFLAIGDRRGIRERMPAPPPPSANLRAMAQKMARGPRRKPMVTTSVSMSVSDVQQA